MNACTSWETIVQNMAIVALVLVGLPAAWVALYRVVHRPGEDDGS